MYYSLAAALSLALFLVLSFLASLPATIAWRVLSPFIRNCSARLRAQIIFGLRILPVAGSLIFITAFLLPAYFLYEPHSTDEVVSFKLLLAALLSFVGIATAFRRVRKTLRATGQLTENWLNGAEMRRFPNVPMPVYLIDHPFPVFAIVGTFRPRMFVARQVLESLEKNEIEAAIMHEFGHLAAHDNFKRILFKICRDLLIIPCGKHLDEAWAENVETAADEYAAHKGGRQLTLNLASALIKIARMVPKGSTPGVPVAAYLIEDHNCDITKRVKKLLEIAEDKEFFDSRRQLHKGLHLLIYSGVLLFFIILFTTDYYFLQKIHFYVEIIVASV